MNAIPRKSKFILTDEEKELLREYNDEILKKYAKRGMSEKNLIIDLYYNIGMNDYWIYRDVNSNEEDICNNTKKYLSRRAIDSARLQVLLEDKSIDMDSLFKFEDETLKISNSVPVYHGTAEDVKSDEIGKPNKNGVYAIRDGVSYWTLSKEKAEKYAKPSKHQIDKGLTSGNVFEKNINNEDKCRTIPATHGGACFIWQDEFIKMNQAGIKYLFPKNNEDDGYTKDDVLDISYFADFVQERDKCMMETMKQYGLSLPKKSDSLFRIS